MASEGHKFWMHGDTGKIHQWMWGGASHGQKAGELGLPKWTIPLKTGSEGAIDQGHIRGGEADPVEHTTAYLHGKQNSFLKHKPQIQEYIGKHLRDSEPVKVEIPTEYGRPGESHTLRTGVDHSSFWNSLERKGIK